MLSLHSLVVLGFRMSFCLPTNIFNTSHLLDIYCNAFTCLDHTTMGKARRLRTTLLAEESEAQASGFTLRPHDRFAALEDEGFYFLLQDLPREIRDYIYELMITADDARPNPGDINEYWHPRLTTRRDAGSKACCLLRDCDKAGHLTHGTGLHCHSMLLTNKATSNEFQQALDRLVPHHLNFRTYPKSC